MHNKISPQIIAQHFKNIAKMAIFYQNLVTLGGGASMAPSFSGMSGPGLETGAFEIENQSEAIASMGTMQLSR